MREPRCLGLHLRAKHFCVRWRDDNEEDSAAAAAADADDVMAGTDAALHFGSFIPRTNKGLLIQTYGIPGAGMLTRPQPHEAEAEAEATTHEAEAEAEATTHEAEAEAEATTHEAEAEAEATTHDNATNLIILGWVTHSSIDAIFVKK